MSLDLYRAHRPSPANQARLDEQTWRRLLKSQLGATHATTGVAS